MTKPIIRSAIFSPTGLRSGVRRRKRSLPRAPRPASLSTSIIGMFPKTVGEFAYADLKAARKFPWFPQLYGQVLPPKFRQFEQFLGSSGVDPNSQVEEIAWANVSSGSDGRCGGHCARPVRPCHGGEPNSRRRKFRPSKCRAIISTLSAAERPRAIFCSSSSIPAPPLSATAAVLEHLINVRMGGEETLLTGKLFPLISEANGNGIIWAVLDKDHTHLAMQQLVPQAGQFPQAAAIIGRLHAMIININADSGVDAHFSAVCDSVDDANLLGAAMQAGIMYRRYQEAQGNPSLAKTLDQVKVTPTGDRLKIELPVSQEELLSLIQTKAFAAPM